MSQRSTGSCTRANAFPVLPNQTKAHQYNSNNVFFIYFRIHWKNDPPAKGEQYKPTAIEHKANILTHGVRLFIKALQSAQWLNTHRYKNQTC